MKEYINARTGGANPEISIIPYEAKYRDDMLFCYLSAKDAVGAYAPEPERHPPALKADLLDIENRYFARGDVFYLAVNEYGRVVGMLGTHTVSPTDLWLKRLFIKPELKGRGIGGRLLSTVEAYAAGRGITTIHTSFAVWYREAAAFYPAKGFVEAASEDGHSRHMVKALNSTVKAFAK